MAQITLTESEYQKLKDKVEEYHNDAQEYKKLYDDMKPEFLRKRLKENAFRLANLYLQTIFKKLGFDINNDGYYLDSLKVDRCTYLPDNWYLDEGSISVILEAHLTNKMREAFVRIGVLTKEEKQTDPLEIETRVNN